MTNYRPLGVAACLAALITIALFMATALGNRPGRHTIAAGPITFWVIERVDLAAGSTNRSNPGIGTLLIWVVVLGAGLAVSLRRRPIGS